MAETTIEIIAAQAGLKSGHVLVKRYFGFRQDLLIAASTRLTDVIVELLSTPRENLTNNEVVNSFIFGGSTHAPMRKRFLIMNELFDETFDFKTIREDSMRIIESMAANYGRTGVSEKTAHITAVKTFSLLYAQYTMWEQLELPKSDQDGVSALAMFELGNARSIEQQLGWSDSAQVSL